MNFEKSSFSRMKDPISRLKRGRQRIRRQVRLNAGGNNFFENFGNEVDASSNALCLIPGIIR